MYKVIKYFTDLQDDNYPYVPGDKYPRDGLEVSNERIIELATVDNKQNTQLITFVEDEDVKKAGDPDDYDTDGVQNDDGAPKENEQTDETEKPKKPAAKKK